MTPTAGGPIGCVGALVLGLAMRRLTFDGFVRSLILTGRIIGMIFLIIIGAMIFSRFIAWCKLSDILLALINSFDLHPKVMIFFILIVFFVLGFFLDIVPMLLIGVPICHPVAVALGADPLWFAVLFVLVVQAGVITPPFATILFALKGVIQEVDLGTIFIGILPFVIATIIGVIIMFLEPAVVTWLPDVLY
jgi:TRAP-type C4-dicarboxylate transport system permease large subunit